MRQFGREARAVIGVGTAAIEITGLRMAFECVKNRFSNKIPNRITLRIYNLSETTRGKLVRDQPIRFEVGYQGVRRVLFLGTIRYPNHVHEGAEWVTTLFCMDSWRELAERQVTQTIAAGRPMRQVLDAVIESFKPQHGVELNSLPALPDLLTDKVLSGSSKLAMDELADSFGFGWGFQDGVLEVTGPDPNFTTEAIEISSATGMVGSPVVTDIGIRVKTLLNPALRVKRKIVVESVGARVQVGQIETRRIVPQLHAGTYTIGEVIFKGDTHSNDWTSDISTYRPPRLTP